MFTVGLRIPEDQSDANLTGRYYVNQFEYNDSGVPAGGLVELRITDDLNYETSGIESTSGFVRETTGGYMVMVDGTGDITAVESSGSGEEIPGAMASGGDVLALYQDDFIGIGIQQTSAAAGSEDGGSGGGCFISSIIR